MSELIQLAGALLIVVAGFLLATWIGLALLGATLLIAGELFAQPPKADE